MNPKLLQILVCPITKTKLVWDKEKSRLISRVSGLAFPIRNGIPILLEEEGEKLTLEELEKYKD